MVQDLVISMPRCKHKWEHIQRMGPWGMESYWKCLRCSKVRHGPRKGPNKPI